MYKKKIGWFKTLKPIAVVAVHLLFANTATTRDYTRNVVVHGAGAARGNRLSRNIQCLPHATRLLGLLAGSTEFVAKKDIDGETDNHRQHDDDKKREKHEAVGLV
jgi:hypothetical protein